jgi:putative transposase
MTPNIMSLRKKTDGVGRQLSPERADGAARMAQAKARGLELTGPNGFVKLFTKMSSRRR